MIYYSEPIPLLIDCLFKNPFVTRTLGKHPLQNLFPSTVDLWDLMKTGSGLLIKTRMLGSGTLWIALLNLLKVVSCKGIRTINSRFLYWEESRYSDILSRVISSPITTRKLQKTQNSPEYEDEVANSSSFAIYASFFFFSCYWIWSVVGESRYDVAPQHSAIDV